MSSEDMSFREICLIGRYVLGRNVLGRNVLGRTVLGRNGFWGEMSDIHFFQTTGTEWAELADEIERFIRFLLEEVSIMEWYAFVSMTHSSVID